MVRSWGSMIRLMKSGAETQILTIPKEIVTDKSYPYRPGDRVHVQIEKDGALRVTKANGDE